MAQVKNPRASAGATGDAGSIPGLGRSPEAGDGNPIQHSCWDNTMAEEPGGLQSMGLDMTERELSTHECMGSLRSYTNGCVTNLEFLVQTNIVDESAWTIPCLTQCGHCLISLCFL